MGWALWALAGGLLVVAVLAVTLGVRLVTGRRRARRELDALLAERDQLLARVTELTRAARALRRGEAEGPDYVITRVGDRNLAAPRAGEPGVRSGRRVPDQVVLSAAFGEPLVKVLAFGHGVRRALAPESRNRIGFEVRREMRRSRKVRRREMREAWRQMRSGQSTQQSSRGDGHEDVA
jgi:hypothetical protein